MCRFTHEGNTPWGFLMGCDEGTLGKNTNADGHALSRGRDSDINFWPVSESPGSVRPPPPWGVTLMAALVI